MAGQWFPNAGEAVQHLKQRLAEQTTQERRLKVLEDCQHIFRRKNEEPCRPILPVGGFENLKRNGIWEQILEWLPQPSDVTSAAIACKTFNDYLEEKRIMMMLPKVFTMLRRTRRLEYSGFRDGLLYQKHRDESAEILKLRHVSKAWKQITDQEFFVTPFFKASLPVWHSMDGAWDEPMVCCFRDEEEVDMAIQKLQNPDSCASLIRVVKVDDKLCKNLADFYLKVEEFLKVHGESVWGFRFNDDKITFDNLSRMISKMPHLKVLDLKLQWISNALPNIPRPAVIAWLRDQIANNPLPNLPDLEYANLDCSPNDPAISLVVNEILGKYVDVKGARLGYYPFRAENDVAISSLIWDALRNLSLEYFELAYKVAPNQPDNVFGNELVYLAQFDWPLKSICVSVVKWNFDNDDSINDGDNPDIVVDTSTVFTILRQFNDSLKECVFWSYDVNVNLQDGENGVSVDLPQLNHVHLPMLDNNNSNDSDSE